MTYKRVPKTGHPRLRSRYEMELIQRITGENVKTIQARLRRNKWTADEYLRQYFLNVSKSV